MIKDPEKLLSAYSISQIDFAGKKKILQSNFEKITDAKNTLQLIKKTFNDIKLGLHNFHDHLNTEEYKELMNLANEAKRSVYLNIKLILEDNKSSKISFWLFKVW